ncbi:MAG: leucyl aminopeptidase [Clostridiales bacterium]|nr:leucyl aminopeptidase [Clostridiales bacterium]
MQFQPFDVLPKDARTTVFLLGEDNYKEGGHSALTGEQLAGILALCLKPGKVGTIKSAAREGLKADVYALLPKELTYDKLEELMAEVASTLRTLKAKQVDIALLDDSLKDLSAAFYKQLALVDDGFSHYKTTGIDPIDPQQDKQEDEAFSPTFTLYLPKSMDQKAEEKTAKQAKKLAEGIRITRRLVNEPANVMSPKRLAQEASELAKKHGFEIEVFDEQQIQDMGMQAFYSVAKGSDAPPRFMVMRYMNNQDTKQVLALVGKGLTYDSGGYALKPAAGMDTMFCDMGGAGAVIGAISTLAMLKAKVNVVAIVAACENMISGHAYRNGDIIGSLAGKFIEVVNTDAEGRLTLADAITYAATVIKADKIIDIATLTGAVGVALGNQITGVVADDEGIWEAISAASSKSGDKVWRLPHFDHLAKSNQSERADIKNSGGRMAGTATAALFCRAFAFGVPWGHLDIAGTAYSDKASAKAPLGATGIGAEILTLAAVKLFEQ